MSGWIVMSGLGHGYMDEMGERLLKPDELSTARIKEQYPYSYSPILLFQGKGSENINKTYYSDRIASWDPSRHDELCLKHFGDMKQIWNGRPPVLVEKFFKDWTKSRELSLIRIIEYCNPSNGYAYWRFDVAE